MALQQRFSSSRLGRSTPRRSVATSSVSVSAANPKLSIQTYGAATQTGTVRKANEDRYVVQQNNDIAFVGVFDGHGGPAVAEWLKTKMFDYVNEAWNPLGPTSAIQKAYLQADKKLLSSSSGFMGMGERGVGGSKCGATAATAIIFKDPRDGKLKLLSANVGDARTVLVRAGPNASGPAEQLTVDHVPDDEKERARIESFNPNPKLPLVRYVSGTWRVGGLLALSRAFGDAYMKGNLQFEGLAQGSDLSRSSGFGVIAEPYTCVVELPNEPCWLVVSSDGLYAEEERGGGGGLDNQTVAEILRAAAPGTDPNLIAQAMAKAAVEVGSTDDVTLVVMRLGPA